MPPPLISIIMPCFNAERRLAASCASALTQGYANLELIIVNDGSTDSSASVIKQITESDPRVIHIEQSNSGAGSARNAGLSCARGEYTAFLDADDSWSADFLESMLAALSANPDAALAYCGWKNLYEDKEDGVDFIPPDYETDEKVATLLKGCRWPIHGALCRTTDIREVGGFNAQLTSCMDYDLWLRIASFRKIVLVPKVMAFYHHHAGEQITHNRSRIALNHWRIQKSFIAENKALFAEFGAGDLKEILYDELLHRGYTCYWHGDLAHARIIFRAVMKAGYGGVKDWLYMLPSILPLKFHNAMLQIKRKRTQPGG